MQQENMRERAHALFEYLKEVCLLTQQNIVNIDKQPGAVPMRNLDDSTCIELFSRDTAACATESENDTIFSFHKPDFTACPAPDASLECWLMPGWNDYRKPLAHHEHIEIPTESANQNASVTENVTTERLLTIKSEQQSLSGHTPTLSAEAEPEPLKVDFFADSSERVDLYDAWAEVRAAWVEREKHTERLRDTFNDLFDIYNQHRRTPDVLEIMIGNGLLTDKHNKDIKHPLFLKRVVMTLDPVHNTLKLSDTDEPPQMYLPLFSFIEDVNVDTVRPMEKKAEDSNIHPLDSHEGADLMKSVAHQLHASSRYQDDSSDNARAEERIIVRWEPYVFLRKRPDGTIKAIEAILDAIAKGMEIPPSVGGVLGHSITTKSDELTNTGDSRSEGNNNDNWANIGKLPLEDDDILLPKPANREQIQIVRQIEHMPAVLVQGPPGTGKTHTIANLLGHFLANGKTVLVTSHTAKALAVLKEKLPKSLQALCVAMLDDSRADMEESVGQIIERTSLSGYHEQKAYADRIRAQRHQTLLDLQHARSLVYAIRHKEFEPIVYCGDSYSPSEAASYVAQHEKLTELIPGEVPLNAVFPLSDDELNWLYESNGILTKAEENELTMGLPNAERLMTPQQFADGLGLYERLGVQLKTLNDIGMVNLKWKPNRYAVICQQTDQVCIQQGDCSAANALCSALSVYEEAIPDWAVYAVSDGAEDGLTRKRWEQLISLIDEAYMKAKVVFDNRHKKPIKIISSTFTSLKAPYTMLLEDAKKHGHVKKNLLMSKEKKSALDSVTISGRIPETAEEIREILAYFDMLTLREQLEPLWNGLIASHGAKRFADLGDEPEISCFQQRNTIAYWVNWVNESRKVLYEQAEHAGIGAALLQPLTSSASYTEEKAMRVLCHITTQLAPAANLLHLVNELCDFTKSKENMLQCLMHYKDSAICAKLKAAIDADSAEAYESAICSLKELQQKTRIQQRRFELLERIQGCAPEWASALRNRADCHGDVCAPADLLTAWKVRQLSMMVDEITSTSLSEAERKVAILTARFRKDTEQLAAALAWCCLQQRIDNNPGIRQSLNGWKQTIAKIGKGTGKRAPALRAEARKLMIECQKAVPAWIMPVSGVMSTINPASTKFDVVIVDEASQSDITASVILYMGKKTIIVGDDEQVSPLAVGLDETKLQNLMTMLIMDKIPNAHLWDTRTSIYDIAAQVYQPLMLREHFRCVPDIIGYSNMLSYQGKIKPLREAGSSPFKTAVVPFRVQGIRKGRNKINQEEANCIVALMKACIEQKEYQDKSFGVISMLGDDQAKLINRKLANEVPLVEYEKHQMLCGNASTFQGDERDVIFLSMVDSNEAEGPLAMASGEGQGPAGKAMKQRYNVAVSRAKDQIWIIHSLDYSVDLKPGDMRRRLLEYAANPHVASVNNTAIDEASDSPFEAEVAKALVAKGYHIVQQYPVGAYYIDMVAIDGNRRIAIECDGERWHSSEEQIRNDMERQSILERLGWKFIRIRGSEYYRARSQAISRVASELNEAGINPEASAADTENADEDALLMKIKARAMQLMKEIGEIEVPPPPVSREASVNRTPRHTSTTLVQVPFVSSESPVAIAEPPVKSSVEAVPMNIAPEDSQPRITPRVSVSAPKDNLLTTLTKLGFEYLDNRKSSGLIWVFYDSLKLSEFNALQEKFRFKAKLERRGARATDNQPAWCITGQK